MKPRSSTTRSSVSLLKDVITPVSWDYCVLPSQPGYTTSSLFVQTLSPLSDPTGDYEVWVSIVPYTLTVDSSSGGLVSESPSLLTPGDGRTNRPNLIVLSRPVGGRSPLPQSRVPGRWRRPLR